jgi:hypothetical protein
MKKTMKTKGARKKATTRSGTGARRGKMTRAEIGKKGARARWGKGRPKSSPKAAAATTTAGT